MTGILGFTTDLVWSLVGTGVRFAPCRLDALVLFNFEIIGCLG